MTGQNLTLLIALTTLASVTGLIYFVYVVMWRELKCRRCIAWGLGLLALQTTLFILTVIDGEWPIWLFFVFATGGIFIVVTLSEKIKRRLCASPRSFRLPLEPVSLDASDTEACCRIKASSGNRTVAVDVYPSGAVVRTVTMDYIRLDKRTVTDRMTRISEQRVQQLVDAAEALRPHPAASGTPLKEWSPQVIVSWSSDGQTFSRSYAPDSAEPQSDHGAPVPAEPFPDNWRASLCPIKSLLDDLGETDWGL